MRNVVGFVVGVFLSLNVAIAQDRKVFDSYTEARLEGILLKVLDNDQNASESERNAVISILKEFQSVSNHLLAIYENTIESQRKMELLWDDQIALQPPSFDQHLYYRAFYAYYLAMFSNAKGNSEEDLNWAAVYYKVNFGHKLYDFIQGRKAFEQVIEKHPEYRERIEKITQYYAYASAQDIPDEKIQSTWKQVLQKKQLTEEEDAIFSYLYSNELMWLWQSLYSAYKKDSDRRFDLYWDKTFWLQKSDFHQHRGYRQMACTFIADYVNDQKLVEGMSESDFAHAYSDFIDCSILDLKNHYEYNWYKKIEKKQKRKRNKNKKEANPDPDPTEYFDQRNLG